jgi:hypothetical protein
MPSTEDSKRQLLAGVEILDPVLQPHGFRFTLEDHAKGSGGWFASGSYTNGDRCLDLHFRQSLGLVTYHIGEDSVDHETYMRFLGVYGRNEYPDFPENPLESFHHLAADIRNYCADFISGNGQQFLSFAATLRREPTMFKGIS